MADTPAATGLRVQQWDDNFFTEYVRENRFKPYMGTGESDMIQVKEDLSKKKGDRLTYALVNRLTAAGVTGSSTLEGNEEAMDSRSHLLTVDKVRNAVRVAEMEEQKSAIDLREAARAVLKDWIMEKTRDDIIKALGSFRNGNSILSWSTTAEYSAIAEATKDAWLVDNADRVLFGASISNGSSNDISAALGNIDTTNDLITPGRLSLLKRIAETANPKIKPIKVRGDEEWFVVFVGSRNFRNLQNDATFTAANREARDRGKDNPLFTGADLVWDGLIIRKIPEIPVLVGLGASTSDVEPVYLCGAQAIGMGWAKRTKSVVETFDYGDKYGVAIEEIRGIEKLHFGSGAGDTDDQKQHGVATGFFSAAADA
jgi:N4-gp56 family major capsid protein